MARMVCPCCMGEGAIEEQPPVKLSVTQQKIYDIVKRARYGIAADDLRDKLYADREDGGPETPSTLHVTIMQMNKRLAVAGMAVRGTSRGVGSVYRLIPA